LWCCADPVYKTNSLTPLCIINFTLDVSDSDIGPVGAKLQFDDI